MTPGKFVQKQSLINEIKQTVLAQESAFFSILTDMKRSALLRFSMGKLIHSYCRGRDVTLSIKAINECSQLKFTRSSGQLKDAPEIMQAELFLESIGGGGTAAKPGLGEGDSVATTVGSDVVGVTEELRTEFVEIARDYIGLVADMLVVDICLQGQPLDMTIEQIAKAMPAKAQSDAFRERALALIAPS